MPEAAHFQQVFFLLLDSIADRYFSMAIIVKTKKNNTKEKKKRKNSQDEMGNVREEF